MSAEIPEPERPAPPPSLPDRRRRSPLVQTGGAANPSLVFLDQAIDHPNITVGAYSYAHDPAAPTDWAAQLAPYLFEGAPERLEIGKFCQIAAGVRFITASAEHPQRGLSTYPFAAFDPSRMAAAQADAGDGPLDTVIGHDCWLGRDALILPGARLGCGVIVGARAVVSGAVPDFAIVAGNPARILRKRFSDEVIDALVRLAWWDWPDDRIAAAIPALEAGDVAALIDVAGADVAPPSLVAEREPPA